jgi:hypothetical protein
MTPTPTGDGYRLVASGAKDAHPLAFLGEVDELEVDGEGPRDRLGAVRVEDVDELDDLAQPLFCLGAAAPAQLDGRPAQPLDVFEQALAVGFLEDLAEDRAEEPDLSPERGGRVLQLGSDRYFFAFAAAFGLAVL